MCLNEILPPEPTGCYRITERIKEEKQEKTKKRKAGGILTKCVAYGKEIATLMPLRHS
jgi:hypothetical protein